MHKVGFITTSYPRFDGDLAGPFVREMARAFVEQNIEVDVIQPGHPPLDANQTPPNDPRISTFHVNYAWPSTRQTLCYGAGIPDNLEQHKGTTIMITPLLWAMNRTIQKHMPHWDAVVSHWLVPGALLGFQPQFNRPHLSIAHSGDIHLLEQLPAGPLLAQLIARRTPALGFVAAHLRDRFLNLLSSRRAKETAQKCHITPMGIWPNQFSPKKTKTEIRSELNLDRFTLLFLGRLVPIKGADTLINALSGHNWSLMVAGDGPERSRLEQLARKRQVDAQFVGVVDESRRAELLTAADALVIPSRPLQNGRTEGCPMVISEAMQSGCPVIASDLPGTRELIIDGETGILFRPSSAPSLTAAIKKAVQNSYQVFEIINNSKKLAIGRHWSFLAPQMVSLLSSQERLNAKGC